MYQYVAFPKYVYNADGETLLVNNEEELASAKQSGFDEPENVKPKQQEQADGVRTEEGRGEEAPEEVTDDLTDGAPESVEAPKPRRGRPPKSERPE